MEALATREIAGAATPESAWRPFLEGLNVPDVTLPVTSRLVALAPHPDDETLACGGLIHSHVSAGGACLVVAATDGEASHGAGAIEQMQALAARRRREQLASAAALGLAQADVLRLGLPDGALGGHIPELERRLDAVLRPRDVLLTTWMLDGHPDHEACGSAAASVAMRRMTPLLQAPVWAWHWAAVADRRLPWARLRRLRLTPEVSAAKLRALACHDSQLQPRGEHIGPVLELPILERAARPCEYYFAQD